MTDQGMTSATASIAEQDAAAVESALEAALYELDDEEDEEDAKSSGSLRHPSTNVSVPLDARDVGSSESIKEAPRVVFGPPRPPPPEPEPLDDSALDSEMEALRGLMAELLQQESSHHGESETDQALQSMLRDMQSQLPASVSDAEPKIQQTAKTSEESRSGPSPVNASQSATKDLDAAIQNLVENMASQVNDPGTDQVKVPLDDASADALLDGMMEQLLSKDLMYEPMKQVADRFPQWLKDNQMYLSAQEYNDRQKQAACFRRLVAAYETDSSNTKLFMTLMQDAQEFGQPPADLLKDIAPDLELDEKGMPKMDGMPFPLSDEECRIM